MLCILMISGVLIKSNPKDSFILGDREGHGYGPFFHSND